MMAWMFTKSQTGYLDEYWGLESSGNCCPTCRSHPEQTCTPDVTTGRASASRPRTEMPGVPGAWEDGRCQSPLGRNCWCAHWRCGSHRDDAKLACHAAWGRSGVDGR